ncbi:smad nuclear interacting protein 1-like [Haliotis cracherodii]|uniref:smad nuclear interacting protein 1-like n=1 Tax=Haliotis cracherodii TaxID=6455 RepID=UPI0039E74AC5
MSDSSSEDERVEYERRKRKKHRSRSQSPRENRGKHKKHKKHKRHSDSDEDDRREARNERDRNDHRRHRPDKYDPHKKIKQEPDDDLRNQRRERERNDDRRRKARRQRERENNDDDQFQFGQGRNLGPEPPVKTEPKEKEKPNFEVSGKLAEDTNTYRGVVIKYNEPPEARKPRRKWRLYPFKGDQALPMLHLHRQSAFLLGRDRRVADIPVDHPSCSKQHAALQFRLVEGRRDNGAMCRQVKPYVIDLGSANGTFVNNKQIEAQRYVELLEKDVLKFGFSTREYVLLHEKADTSELHDEDEEDSS